MRLEKGEEINCSAADLDRISEKLNNLDGRKSS